MKKVLLVLGILIFIIGAIMMVLNSIEELSGSVESSTATYDKINAISSMLTGICFYIFAQFKYKEEYENLKREVSKLPEEIIEKHKLFLNNDKK